MLKNLKNKKKKKGFTLIELIIVIAIIALLAALAIPKFGDIRKNAALKSDIANAKTIANAASTLLLDGNLAAEVGKEIKKPADAVNPADNGEKVGKELQNIPKTKYKYGTVDKGASFYITVDSNNNITIYGGTVNSANELFPNPVTSVD